jgi:Transglycosylase-like domain
MKRRTRLKLISCAALCGTFSFLCGPVGARTEPVVEQTSGSPPKVHTPTGEVITLAPIGAQTFLIRADQVLTIAPAQAPVPPPPPPQTWTWPWSCIAQYESGGNPAEDTGNGYYGGLQFDLTSWYAAGGVGMPQDASIAEQEAVANTLLTMQGWGAWPNTSAMCGL